MNRGVRGRDRRKHEDRGGSVRRIVQEECKADKDVSSEAQACKVTLLSCSGPVYKGILEVRGGHMSACHQVGERQMEC